MNLFPYMEAIILEISRPWGPEWWGGVGNWKEEKSQEKMGEFLGAWGIIAPNFTSGKASQM